MSSNPTPHRILGKDATAGLADALALHMPCRSLLLVCDDATLLAAGERAAQLLASSHEVTTHSLGKYVEARMSHAKALAALAKEYDALLAVGSGTINDITKYAATLANKPYSVIATAASMNGYSSVNASLLEDNGFKHSLTGVTPRAVIADTTIIAAAPKRLTRAGLGDTLCRSTVEADMLLSHHLLGTAYPRALFEAMRRHEADLITGTAAAREGDASFIGKLMLALLDAGDAMTSFGSSAPASQGEHMIAHTLELMYGSELHNVLHGEMVAITTLTVNQLQHKMMLGSPTVKALPREAVQFERLFGKKIGPKLAAAYADKVLNIEQAHEINTRLEKQWPEIKAELASIMIAPNSIERALIHSGGSTRAKEIGLSDERYRNACTYAYLTRERFTFLDLAAMNDKRVG